jgi:hypothetical protein
MDLSNIQPIHKRFDNELEAEKFLSQLSTFGGKKVEVITIYRGGSYVYVWFYYDRLKIGFKKPEEDGIEKADKIKKPRKTKAS